MYSLILIAAIFYALYLLATKHERRLKRQRKNEPLRLARPATGERRMRVDGIKFQIQKFREDYGDNKAADLISELNDIKLQPSILGDSNNRD